MIKGYGVEKTRILERMYYYEKIIHYSVGSSDPVCSSTTDVLCRRTNHPTNRRTGRGEGEEGNENLPEIEPTHINGPAGDNN